jgi:hypothetical protein
MSKIALITDTHFGIRGDSTSLIYNAKKFFTNIFFPILEAKGITTIIHLGDTFDRRKFVNYGTLNSYKEEYFEKLKNNNYDYHQIIGNHDTFFKYSNEVNSPNLLLKEYNWPVYTESTEIEVYGEKILLLPWLTPENNHKAIADIKSSEAKICLGHLEINGFEMHRGVLCDHGLDKKLFDKFEFTASGHFHLRAYDKGIHYLGCPYEMEWSDYGNNKGFHILDVKTRNLEFIHNPFKLFHKLIYDDTDTETLPEVDQTLTDSYIRVIIRNKNNPFVFDKFIDSINEFKPANLTISEETQIQFEEGTSSDNIKIEDTMTTLRNYVNNVKDLHVPKKKLVNYLTGIYKEAMDIEI